MKLIKLVTLLALIPFLANANVDIIECESVKFNPDHTKHYIIINEKHEVYLANTWYQDLSTALKFGTKSKNVKSVAVATQDKHLLMGVMDINTKISVFRDLDLNTGIMKFLYIDPKDSKQIISTYNTAVCTLFKKKQ